VKNDNCYDIKIGQWYNVDILILIKISLHENVRRVGMDFHIYRVHLLVCYIWYEHCGCSNQRTGDNRHKHSNRP